ncbi:MAG TPA: HEPN domain-containing protein [Rectinemataceae bacterium]|nr:HEPN domain-containing protein [Rectinemataceae bacterium]
MKSRAGDWLRQAENELAWAADSMKGGYWAQTCFAAQQVAEKALKALAIARGASEVRSHSLAKIADALDIDGELLRMGKRLDLYYISARYPDAFAEGAPFEFFDAEQAAEAIEFAKAFLARARAELSADG